MRQPQRLAVLESPQPITGLLGEFTPAGMRIRRQMTTLWVLGFVFLAVGILLALRFFDQAWAARRDDFDAAVAAHFLARHQSTPAATLHWNVRDDRTAGLLASLYLNLDDAHARLGQQASARAAVQYAADHLAAPPAAGYREFVAMGIDRLTRQLETPPSAVSL